MLSTFYSFLLLPLKGRSQLWHHTDLDTTFASLKSIYLNPKSNIWQRQILLDFNPLQSLPSVSLDPHSFTENLLFSKLLILSHYFIDLVKHNIQRNMKRRGEKCSGTRQGKSPSFNKIFQIYITFLHQFSRYI